MGWYYPFGATLKGLKGELTENFVGPNGSRKCLASCFRGNICFRGVLWSVWEVEESNGNSFRYIECDLMECRNGSWGYKSMDEKMGPLYYSCPLKYLRMVPVDKHPETTNVKWRKELLLRKGKPWIKGVY